jgi:CRP-like cAMP-binding protein
MVDPKAIWSQAVAAASQKTGGESAPLRQIRARPHENRVLASLPQSDMALLARHVQVISVRPGTVLHLQEHPIEHVYFPHEGLVSLHAMAPDGHMIQAASVGRGGAVRPLLEFGVRESFLTAVALGAMRVSRIGAEAINAAQRESETINRALGACREALLLQLRQNIVCDGLHVAEQRVARWLLETADRLESDTLPIPVTQEYVAQCLGIRRTTVTLLVRALQNVEAIRWGRSQVGILDRAPIEARACSCYAALRERMSKLLPSESAFAGSEVAD